MAIALRLGRAYDEARTDEQAGAFARIATAASKYHVCKRAPGMVYEALECFGGNGFVEEAPVARLYREAPLNSVWEGSGNVMCLDVLRAMVREPDALDAVRQELASAAGVDRRYDAFVQRLSDLLANGKDAEIHARRIVEHIAMALQASVLLKAGNAVVSDAFVSARLSDSAGTNYGTLTADADVDALIERAMPA